MVKKKQKMGLLGLIMSIVGIAGAVLSFIALSFNFINTQTTIGNSTTSSTTNLSKWFEAINNAQEYNANLDKTGVGSLDSLKMNIDGWATARVFLIITLILVALVAVALVVKFFINNKILNLATMVVAALTVVSAIIFIIMVYVGGNALLGNPENVKVMADVGAWCVTLGAAVAGVMGVVVARK